MTSRAKRISETLGKLNEDVVGKNYKFHQTDGLWKKFPEVQKLALAIFEKEVVKKLPQPTPDYKNVQDITKIIQAKTGEVELIFTNDSSELENSYNVLALTDGGLDLGFAFIVKK